MRSVTELLIIEPLIDVFDAAKILGVHVSTIYAWIHQGKIPYIKLLNKSVRFRSSELEKWISEQSCPVRQQPVRIEVPSVRSNDRRPSSEFVGDIVAQANVRPWDEVYYAQVFSRPAIEVN
jgi:excisionase family DNA binding protein